MTSESDVSPAFEELPQGPRIVVAAVVKKAFGLAVGTAGALWLGAIATIGTFHAYSGETHGSANFTWLIGANFLPHYAPTWSGVLFGIAYGFVGGFLLGFGVALARNRLLKFLFWLDAVRVRLRVNRTVLDDLS